MRRIITIMNRFTPFTNSPGVGMLLPGSPYVIKAFPTRIEITRGKEKHTVILSLTGPVEKFTTLQNQEKNRVEIFGQAQEGFFFFYLSHQGEKLTLTLHRGKSVEGSLAGKPFTLRKGESLEISVEGAVKPQIHVERLSLGINKELNWQAVEKRFDLKEMLPLLFFLGQKYPASKKLTLEKEKEYQLAIQAYFDGLLTPQTEDSKFLGLPIQALASSMTKEEIVASFYASIRSLFFQEKEGKIYLLPHLWPSLPSGRILSLQSSYGEIDIEWTKKKLRRVHLRAVKSGEISFVWPKEIASYRLKRHVKERGMTYTRENTIIVQAGHAYLLDRFER